MGDMGTIVKGSLNLKISYQVYNFRRIIVINYYRNRLGDEDAAFGHYR